MDFSSLFTQDPTFIHLNAGTRSRVPLRVLEYQEAERRAEERNPTEAMLGGYDRLWDVQKLLAENLGASPHDIFLRNNITGAFNDFLFALPAPERGSEVVATGWEYGALVNSMRHWAALEGLTFRSAPLAFRTDWNEDSLTDAILESLRPETRVLLLSHVTTSTGAILPVARCAREARRQGVIVIIDGAHALGALPLALGQLEADFYGGNFHKWFLGPEGTGFGWVHPRWRDELRWKFGGWATFQPPPSFRGFGDGNPETCRRFFPGTIDRVPFLALRETLAFWQEHGPEKIRARQTALRDCALEEAIAAGFEPRSPVESRASLGPLVSFALPASWTEEPSALQRRILAQAKVQIAISGAQGVPLLRLSPGVYCSEEEVRHGIAALRAFR